MANEAQPTSLLCLGVEKQDVIKVAPPRGASLTRKKMKKKGVLDRTITL